MTDNFLNTNYSYILDNIYDCGSVSDIKPALFDSNNNNPNTSKNLPLFSHGTNIFTTPGKIWCMNRENQDKCIADENYILKPIYNQTFSNEFQYNNNLNYSNNIISNIDKNVNTINVGKKYNSTGIHADTSNSYINVDTSGNPYPANINFTSDNISFSQLEKLYKQKQCACNNRSIENRFRPVYLHIPDQFLEVCDPIGYERKNNAEKY